MRVPTPSAGQKNVSINMTPMIDMVFLLIIFFIVSSNMVQQETGVPVDLPSARTGELPRDDDAKKIVITVLGDGSAVLGTQQVPLEQLRDYLLAERKGTRKPLKVRIRADRMTPYGSVEPIMVACRESGISDVVFSVLAEK
ncbi:MAG: biopolymer transporter ExbD [Planctomycetaceae bacterium]|jgi:biopolymer transport protein ExbD|nr:biopolymer transporter ExbD [Planctomycetaceae bacterium]